MEYTAVYALREKYKYELEKLKIKVEVLDELVDELGAQLEQETEAVAPTEEVEEVAEYNEVVDTPSIQY